MAPGNRFSIFGLANYEAVCRAYQDQYIFPTNQIDTTAAAYNMAIRWLTAAPMDVFGLNRDCHVDVELSSYLKDLFIRLPGAKITQIKNFTPAAWAKAKAREKVVAQAA